MNEQTRYRYEKRIKELEKENWNLKLYKIICSEIYGGILEVWNDNKSISHSWIIKKFERVWK